METTLLLSKVFGIYLVIASIAILSRRRYFMMVMSSFVKDGALRLVISIFELAGGLFIILNHNLWGTLQEGIITVFGWAMAVEGAVYLFLSDRAVGRIIRKFNHTGWYIGGGAVSIAAGVYLVLTGFGWL